jgi:hypothetical protein
MPERRDNDWSKVCRRAIEAMWTLTDFVLPGTNLQQVNTALKICYLPSSLLLAFNARNVE